MRESVREIMKAQERSTHLVRQLLAFSRRQVVDPQIITLNQVITDIQKMLAKILGEDVELMLEIEPDPSLNRSRPTPRRSTRCS